MKNLIVALVLIFFVSGFSSYAYAQQETNKVVLFTATWNASSRSAKKFIPAVIKKYNNVEYIDLDVDSPFTPEQARKYDVNIPKSTPYLYLVNKNGKVLSEFSYQDNTEFQRILAEHIEDLE